MSDVELRELRYFVAVAEELNFSRAAERLGIAQSPLSRAITQLESRIGVRLLERTTRYVELTLAGATLLDQARHVLDGAAAAITRTRRAGQPEQRLAVAMKPSGHGSLIREIIAEYDRPGLPSVEVTVTSWGGPCDLVRSGAADVALLRSPLPTRDLEVWELWSEPRIAALPVGHRLASRTRLRRADLAGEPLPQWPGADPATNAYWTGQDPHSVSTAWGGKEITTAGPDVSDLAQLLEVVALGQAIAFLPASTAGQHAVPGIVYVPVTDLSPSLVAVAWPRDSRSPAIAAFVEAAARIAERTPDSLTAIS
jgi:DNA-binding transcriptional LysR family regulator